MLSRGEKYMKTLRRFWEKQRVEKVWLLYTLCKMETDIE
jgi:hypothetical protein